MKKILCILICLCTLTLTGCSSYERDENPGEVRTITVDELQKMIDQEESFAVVFTQPSCEYCEEMHIMLDNYILDHNILLYEVVLGDAPEQDRAAMLKQIRKTFVGLDNTPTLYYVKDGKVDEETLEVKKDNFDSFVQNHRLDEKK